MIDTILNVLLIILGFGLLIFVHELGHFIAARWANIRVEAFAIGMGPVLASWRKGIGVKFGSTTAAVEQRVKDYYARNGQEFKPKDEQECRRMACRAMDAAGIGETEYSLRWLPLGGFVKMLGQEDANPQATSDDPRSYGRCPVGKRMVVVSAGVVMNILLAIALFIWAFMIGVRFEAPLIGSVATGSPAALATAVNAADAGVSAPGLKRGDRAVSIDGDTVNTFADLHIASAMARADQALAITVERPGVATPLEFRIQPEPNKETGLLSIGIGPGASATLHEDNEQGRLAEELKRTGLFDAGIRPHMRLIFVDGTSIDSYASLAAAADSSGGKPLQTQWTALGDDGYPTGHPITAPLGVLPEFTRYASEGTPSEWGLLGMPMLLAVREVVDGSPNADILKTGDVIIRIDDSWYPRWSQLTAALREAPDRIVTIVVLRNKEEITLACKTNRHGQLGVLLGPAEDLPVCSEPVATWKPLASGDDAIPTPAASLNLFPGTRIVAIAGQPVKDWAGIRAAFRAATVESHARRLAASVSVVIQHPLHGKDNETVAFQLTADQVHELHSLGWSPALDAGAFEPEMTMRTANGNPVRAIGMGLDETKKAVLGAYLTIDRLVRGTVGVEQLRGPVGIVHLGTTIADRGPMFLIFFLGMISVNLAVINFLPMPIVDGGLFLFLVFEKIKGRPPSLAFQNAATILGLFLIGALFLITFYNDVMRLVS